MRIVTNYGTQQNIYTPTDEPGLQYITVQITDDEGRPRSDVTIVSTFGEAEGLFLLPLLVVAGHTAFPGLIDHFMRAVRFANVNGGRFDEKAFIEARYAALHPTPPSPIPVPSPVPVPAGGLILTEAQKRIEGYAKGRGLGDAKGMVFTISPGVYGRNYTGGQDANGLCLVVASAAGTFLVRNDFFTNYTGAFYSNRAKLGAPVEDEHSVQGGAEQRFQRGRMVWNAKTNQVAVEVTK
jgi:hypothetical protein